MKEKDLYIGMRVVPHAKTISWDNNARDFLRKEEERWNKKEDYLSISEINFLDILVLGTNVTLINEDFPEWGGSYYSIDDIEPYEDAVYDSKWETKKHIFRVQELIKSVSDILHEKANVHDWSKLSEAEKPYFDEYTPKLKGCTYGSEEYKRYLKELKPALDHHYENNSHHPEHYVNGIEDMTLFDLVEMLMDWKAATERHDNGDIYESIEINKERFNISSQLESILLNTVKEMEYSEGWNSKKEIIK